MLVQEQTRSDQAIERAFASATANDQLELVILPTEKCNLRCVYCYETFERGRMSETTIRAVERLIERRAPELRSLTINWFGGEPLLAPDIMLRIGALVRRLQRRFPDLGYRAGATTNGTQLREPLLAKLIESGVTHYQVSLDGPRSSHDRTRLRADGGGTFATIWRNLLAIRDSASPAHIMIRVHVHPGNLHAVRPFIGTLRTEFLADPRFSVLFMPIAHLGGPNDERFEVLPADQTRRILRELSGLVRDEDSSVTIAATERPALFSDADVCYASKPNAWVIRSDGTLAKCTVAFEDPRNALGRLHDDGTLEIDAPRLAPWFRGWREQNWSGIACPHDAYFHEEAGSAAGGTAVEMTIEGRRV